MSFSANFPKLTPRPPAGLSGAEQAVQFDARIGGALIAFNMLVAFALVHAGQLGQLNEQGGWALELQGMYLAAAIAIALIGPGKYSLGRGK